MMVTFNLKIEWFENISMKLNQKKTLTYLFRDLSAAKLLEQTFEKQKFRNIRNRKYLVENLIEP